MEQIEDIDTEARSPDLVDLNLNPNAFDQARDQSDIGGPSGSLGQEQGPELEGQVETQEQSVLISPGDMEPEQETDTFCQPPPLGGDVTSSVTDPHISPSASDLTTNISPELHSFFHEMTDEQWMLISKGQPDRMTKDEFARMCLNIVAYVKETATSVLIPVLQLETEVTATEESTPSGVHYPSGLLGSNGTGRLFHGVIQVSNSCSRRILTPYPSPHSRSQSSLQSEEAGTLDEEVAQSLVAYQSSSEDRPLSAPLRSLFGVSQDTVFSTVQNAIFKTLSEVELPSNQKGQKQHKMGTPSAQSSLVFGIVDGVMEQVNSCLANAFEQSAYIQASLAPGTTNRPTNVQLAQGMLHMVSEKMHAHVSRQRDPEVLSLHVKSSLEVMSEIGSKLAAVAVQIVVAILETMIDRATRVSNFLSAVSEEVKTLAVHKGSTENLGNVDRVEHRLFARRSSSESLLSISKARVIKAVKQKMSSSQFIHPGCYLSNNRITTMSIDVVDVVFSSVLSALDFVDSQTPSTGSQSSCSTPEGEPLDIRCVVGEMVRNVSVKLEPFVSQRKSKCSSHSYSDINQLYAQSALVAATACQAIKTELDSEIQYNPAKEASSQGNLVARDVVASLTQSLEDADIADIIQGRAAILEQSAVTKHPEIPTTVIYRSLLLEPYLTSCPPSEKVIESIVFRSPDFTESDKSVMFQESKENTTSPQSQSMQKLSELCHPNGRQMVSQIIREAADMFATKDTVNPLSKLRTSIESQAALSQTSVHHQMSKEAVSCHISSQEITEVSSGIYDGVLEDLHDAVEANKALLAHTQSGPKVVWEQVHSVALKLFHSVQDKLNNFFMVQHLTNKIDIPETTSESADIIPILTQDYTHTSARGLLLTSASFGEASTQCIVDHASSQLLRSRSDGSADQLTLNSCTKEVIQHVLSSLKSDVSKEDVSLESCHTLGTVISTVEELASVTRGNLVLLSEEFQTKAKKIVSEVLLKATSVKDTELLSNPTTATPISSQQVLSSATDIVNIIVKDMESFTQSVEALVSVEHSDSAPQEDHLKETETLRSNPTPKLTLDKFLVAAKNMFHRVQGRVDIFFSHGPLTANEPTELGDSMPAEKPICTSESQLAVNSCTNQVIQQVLSSLMSEVSKEDSSSLGRKMSNVSLESCHTLGTVMSTLEYLGSASQSDQVLSSDGFQTKAKQIVCEVLLRETIYLSRTSVKHTELLSTATTSTPISSRHVLSAATDIVNIIVKDMESFTQFVEVPVSVEHSDSVPSEGDLKETETVQAHLTSKLAFDKFLVAANNMFHCVQDRLVLFFSHAQLKANEPTELIDSIPAEKPVCTSENQLAISSCTNQVIEQVLSSLKSEVSKEDSSSLGGKMSSVSLESCHTLGTVMSTLEDLSNVTQSNQVLSSEEFQTKAKQIVTEVLLKETIPLPTTSVKDTELFSTPTTATPITSELVLSAATDIVNIIVKDIESFTQSVESPVSFEHGDSAPPEDDLKETETVQVYLTPKLALDKFLVAANSMFHSVQDRLVVFFSDAPLTSNGPTDLVNAISAEQPVCSSENQLAVNSCTNQVIQQVLSSLKSEVSKEDISSLGGNMSSVSLESCHTLGTVMSTLENLGSESQTDQVLSSDEFQTKAKQVVCEVLLRQTISLARTSVKDIELLSTHTTATPISSSNVLSTATDIVNIIVKDMESFTQVVKAPVSVEHSDSAHSEGDLKETETLQAHLTTKLAFENFLVAANNMFHHVQDRLVVFFSHALLKASEPTELVDSICADKPVCIVSNNIQEQLKKCEPLCTQATVYESCSLYSSVSETSASDFSENQLAVNSCTKEIVQQVLSSLKYEVSKEDISSLVGTMSSVSLGSCDMLGTVMSTLEDLSSVAQSNQVLSSEEFQTKAKQIVSEVLLRETISLPRTSVKGTDLLSTPTTTTPISSRHVLSAATDIVNIIVKDMESFTQFVEAPVSVEHSDVAPSEGDLKEIKNVQVHLTPKLSFDKFLVAANIMLHHVQDRLVAFFTHAPLTSNEPTELVDSIPAERPVRTSENQLAVHSCTNQVIQQVLSSLKSEVSKEDSSSLGRKMSNVSLESCHALGTVMSTLEDLSSASQSDQVLSSDEFQTKAKQIVCEVLLRETISLSRTSIKDTELLSTPITTTPISPRHVLSAATDIVDIIVKDMESFTQFVEVPVSVEHIDSAPSEGDLKENEIVQAHLTPKLSFNKFVVAVNNMFHRVQDRLVIFFSHAPLTANGPTELIDSISPEEPVCTSENQLAVKSCTNQVIQQVLSSLKSEVSKEDSSSLGRKMSNVSLESCHTLGTVMSTLENLGSASQSDQVLSSDGFQTKAKQIVCEVLLRETISLSRTSVKDTELLSKPTTATPISPRHMLSAATDIVDIIVKDMDSFTQFVEVPVSVEHIDSAPSEGDLKENEIVQAHLTPKLSFNKFVVAVNNMFHRVQDRLVIFFIHAPLTANGPTELIDSISPEEPVCTSENQLAVKSCTNQVIQQVLSSLKSEVSKEDSSSLGRKMSNVSLESCHTLGTVMSTLEDLGSASESDQVLSSDGFQTKAKQIVCEVLLRETISLSRTSVKDTELLRKPTTATPISPRHVLSAATDIVDIIVKDMESFTQFVEVPVSVEHIDSAPSEGDLKENEIVQAHLTPKLSFNKFVVAVNNMFHRVQDRLVIFFSHAPLTANGSTELIDSISPEEPVCTSENQLAVKSCTNQVIQQVLSSLKSEVSKEDSSSLGRKMSNVSLESCHTLGTVMSTLENLGSASQSDQVLSSDGFQTKAKQIVCEVLLRETISLSRTSVKDTELLNTPITTTPISSRHVLSAATDIVDIIVKDMESFTQLVEAPVSVEHIDSAPSEGHLKENEIVQAHLTPKLAFDKFLVAANNMFHCVQDRLVVFFSHAQLKANEPTELLHSISTERPVCTLKNQLAINSCTNQVIQQVLSSLMSEVSKEDSLSLGRKMSNLFLESCHTLGTVMSTLEDLGIASQSDQVLSSDGFQTKAKQIVCEVLLRETISLCRTSAKDTELLSTPTTATPIFSRHVLSAATDIVNIIVKDMESFTQFVEAPVSVEHSDTAHSKGHLTETETVQAHLTPKLAFDEFLVAVNNMFHRVQDRLVVFFSHAALTANECTELVDSIPTDEAVCTLENQIAINSCTNQVFQHVLSSLKSEVSKEDSSSLGRRMSSLSLESCHTLSTVMSTLEDLGSVTQSNQVLLSEDFQTKAKQIVSEVLLRETISLPKTSVKDTELLSTPITTTPISSRHVLSAATDIVDIIVKDMESFTQLVEAPVSVEHIDSAPSEGDLKETETVQAHLTPKLAFDKFLVAANSMFHRVQDRLVVFFSHAPLTSNVPTELVDSVPAEKPVCTSENQLAVNSCTNQVIQHVLSSLKSEVSKEYSSSLQRKMSSVSLESCHTLGTVMSTLEDIGSASQSDQVLSSDEFQTKAKQIVCEVLLRRTISLSRTPIKDTELLSTPITITPISSRHVLSAATDIVNIIVKDMESFTQLMVAPVSVEHIDSAPSEGDLKETETVQAHLTPKVAFNKFLVAANNMFHCVQDRLVIFFSHAPLTSNEPAELVDSIPTVERVCTSENQLAVHSCTNQVIQQVLSSLKSEVSKEDISSLGGNISSVSFESCHTLGTVMITLEDLSSVAQSNEVLSSEEFQTKAKQIVSEVLLRETISLSRTSVKDTELLSTPTTATSISSKHVLSAATDIVNIIVKDLESFTQFVEAPESLEHSDSAPSGGDLKETEAVQAHLTPKLAFDKFLVAANSMFHRVQDRLVVFFSHAPLTSNEPTELVDSIPAEKPVCTSENQLAVNSCTNQVIQHVLSSLKSEVSKEDSSSLQRKMSSVSLESCHTLGTVMSTLEDIGSASQSDQVLSSDEFQTKAKQIVCEVLLRQTISLSRTSIKDTELLSTPITTTPISSRHVLSAATDIVDIIVKDMESFTQLGEAPVSVEHIDSAPSEGDLKETETVQAHLTPKLAFNKFLVAANNMFHCVQDRLVIFFSHAPLTSNEPAKLVDSIPTVERVCTSENQLAVHSCTNQVIQQVLSSLKSEVSKEDISSLGGNMSNVYLESCHTLGTVMITLEDLSSVAQSNEVLSSEEFQTKAKQIVSEVLLRETISLSRTSVKDTELLSTPTIATPISSRHVLSAATDIVNIIVKDMESFTQSFEAPVSVQYSDSAPSGGDLKETETVQAHITPKLAFDKILVAANNMFHRVQDRLVVFFSHAPLKASEPTYVVDSMPAQKPVCVVSSNIQEQSKKGDPLCTQATVDESCSLYSGVSESSLSGISENQLAVNSCTKEIIQQVLSSLKCEVSKEDSYSLMGKMYSVSLESCDTLGTVMSTLEDLGLASQTDLVLSSVEFQTKAKQIVCEVLLSATISLSRTSVKDTELLRTPTTATPISSRHVLSAATDIVNIIVKDMESFTQPLEAALSLEHSDSTPSEGDLKETETVQAHLTPKLAFDKFLVAANSMFHRVQDRLVVFFSHAPLTSNEPTELVDSIPAEKPVCTSENQLAVNSCTNQVIQHVLSSLKSEVSKEDSSSLQRKMSSVSLESCHTLGTVMSTLEDIGSASQSDQVLSSDEFQTKAKQIVCEVLLRQAISLSRTSIKDTELLSTPITTTPISSRHVLSAATDIVDIIVKYMESFTQLVEAPVSVEHIDSAPSEGDLKEIETVQVHLTPKVAFNKFLVAANNMFHCVQDRLVIFFSHAPLTSNEPAELVDSIPTVERVCTSENQLAVHSCTNQVIQQVLSSLKSEVSKEDISSLGENMSSVSLESCHTLGTVMITLEDLSSVAQSNEVLSSEEFQTQAKQIVSEVLLRETISLSRTSVKDTELLSTPTTATPISSKHVLSAATDIVNIIVKDMESFTQFVEAPVSLEHSDSAPSEVDMKATETVQAHLTPKLAFDKFLVAANILFHHVQDRLVLFFSNAPLKADEPTDVVDSMPAQKPVCVVSSNIQEQSKKGDPLCTQATVDESCSLYSGVSESSLSGISENQLAVNSCTKEIIQQVLSSLRSEVSKEDSYSLMGKMSSVSLESCHTLGTVMSTLEVIGSASQTDQVLSSDEFQTKAKQIVCEVLLRETISSSRTSVEGTELLSTPTTATLISSRHVLSAATDIVNIIVKDMESFTQSVEAPASVEHSDFALSEDDLNDTETVHAHLTPKLALDRFLVAANNMFHRVQDRLVVFFSHAPLTSNEPTELVDSIPAEQPVCTSENQLSVNSCTNQVIKQVLSSLMSEVSKEDSSSLGRKMSNVSLQSCHTLGTVMSTMEDLVSGSQSDQVLSSDKFQTKAKQIVCEVLLRATISLSRTSVKDTELLSTPTTATPISSSHVLSAATDIVSIIVKDMDSFTQSLEAAVSLERSESSPSEGDLKETETVHAHLTPNLALDRFLVAANNMFHRVQNRLMVFFSHTPLTAHKPTELRDSNISSENNEVSIDIHNLSQPTTSVPLLADTSCQGGISPHSDLSERQPLRSLSDPQRITLCAKDVLRQVLSAIKTGVDNSKEASLGCKDSEESLIASDMLDSILESLESIHAKLSSTQNTFESDSAAAHTSATEDITMEQVNRIKSDSNLSASTSYLERNLKQLLSTETIRFHTDDLVNKVHQLLQGISTNHTMLFPSRSEPALAKLSEAREQMRARILELIYNYAENSVRTLLEQCLGFLPLPSGETLQGNHPQTPHSSQKGTSDREVCEISELYSDVMDQFTKILASRVTDATSNSLEESIEGAALRSVNPLSSTRRPRSGTSQATNDIVHKVLDLTVTVSNRDVPSDKTEKNRTLGFLPKIPKIPKIPKLSMKVFEKRVKPQKLSMQEEIPRHLSVSHIPQGFEFDGSSMPLLRETSRTPQREEVSPITIPPPQSPRRPFLARALTALSGVLHNSLRTQQTPTKLQ